MEWHIAVLNLVAKVRGEPYRVHVLRLFSESDMPFSLDRERCSYLYLNGVIDYRENPENSDESRPVCRFSNSLVQERLYNALAGDLVGERLPVRAVDSHDGLEDSTPPRAWTWRACYRYRAYLKRMEVDGMRVETVAIGWA